MGPRGCPSACRRRIPSSMVRANAWLARPGSSDPWWCALPPEGDALGSEDPGRVAQLVEQGTENLRVGGSIPSPATLLFLLPILTAAQCDECASLCRETATKIAACMENDEIPSLLWSDLGAKGAGRLRRHLRRGVEPPAPRPVCLRSVGGPAGVRGQRRCPEDHLLRRDHRAVRRIPVTSASDAAVIGGREARAAAGREDRRAAGGHGGGQHRSPAPVPAPRPGTGWYIQGAW